MSAVLDVVRRPVALCRFVVTLVEQGVEALQDESLVLFRCRLHESSLVDHSRNAGARAGVESTIPFARCAGGRRYIVRTTRSRPCRSSCARTASQALSSGQTSPPWGVQGRVLRPSILARRNSRGGNRREARAEEHT